MSDIPTWHERAMAHPDHQSGMVSEQMLRARMGEEIADLRSEVDRLTRERDVARAEVGRLREMAHDFEAMREDRDEARADADRYLADLRRCASEPYERTRELEALQAEVERLRETKDYLRTWLSSEELEGLRVKAAEHPLLWEEIHHLKDEVERLREALESSGEP